MDTQNGFIECRIEMYRMLTYIDRLEEELQEKKRIIKRLRKKIFFKRALKTPVPDDQQPMDIDSHSSYP